MNIIIHATITGFGGSKLEPNVPKPEFAFIGLEVLLEKFKNHYPLDRIVLRVDPIIPTPKGFEIAKKIIDKGKALGIKRIRISFLDNYPHVKERFTLANIPQLKYDFHAPLEDRIKIWEDLGKPEVCGEPGIQCTGCISKLDCEVLGVLPINKTSQQYD
jgi:hypothetical protein